MEVSAGTDRHRKSFQPILSFFLALILFSSVIADPILAKTILETRPKISPKVSRVFSSPGLMTAIKTEINQNVATMPMGHKASALQRCRIAKKVPAIGPLTNIRAATHPGEDFALLIKYVGALLGCESALRASRSPCFGGGETEVIPPGVVGQPQLGQAGALSEYSFPHSLQMISAT